MATFPLVRPEEGDPFAAADVQTAFTSGAGAINALEKESIQRRSLNHNHIPTLLVGYGQTLRSRTSGGAVLDYAVTQTAPNNAGVYTPGATANWQRLSWDASATLSAVADAVSTTLDTCVQLSSSVDLSNTSIAGIEVRWHLAVTSLGRAIAGSSTTDRREGLGIQVQAHTSDGWYGIQRSERWQNTDVNFSGSGGKQAAENCKNELRGHTLIRLSDITGTSKTVDAVRIVGGRWNWTAAAADNLELRGATLAAWALQAGGP